MEYLFDGILKLYTLIGIVTGLTLVVPYLLRKLVSFSMYLVRRMKTLKESILRTTAPTEPIQQLEVDNASSR